MAKTTTISNLRTELTLNSQKFERGIDRSKKKVGALNKSFGSLKGVLAGILSAGVLVKLTKNALDFADAIGKSAERIGITTDRLQELRFAFDRAGVSAEIVDKGLLNFGKRLGKANDGFGALAEGLKRTDAELLKNVLSAGSMEKSLDAIFEAMGNATSQAQKLAIADAAFGKAGLLMTAAFDDANRTFQKSINLGRKLGIVLDKDLIANAQETNDTLSALSQVLKIQFFDLLLRLSPLIAQTAEGIISMAKGLQSLAASFSPSFASAEQLTERLKGLKGELKEINKESVDLDIGKLFEIFKSANVTDFFTGKFNVRSSEQVKTQIRETQELLERINGQKQTPVVSALAGGATPAASVKEVAEAQKLLNEIIKKSASPLQKYIEQSNVLERLRLNDPALTERVAFVQGLLNKQFEDGTKKTKENKEELERLTDAQNLYDNIIEAGKTPRERLVGAQELLEELYTSGKQSLDEVTKAQEALTMEFKKTTPEALKLADALAELESIRESVKDDFDRFIEKDKLLDFLQEKGEITAEENIELSEKLLDQFKDAATEFDFFVHNIGDDLGDFIFDTVTGAETALDGLRNFTRKVFEDILDEFIRLQFVKPFVESLTGRGGGGGTGGAFLGSIFSGFTSFLGFAKGGQFTVGGEAGIDNNLVSFGATRGERVTVETPAQQRSGGGSVVINQNISTGVSQTVRAELMSLLPQIIERAKKGVLDAQTRGGQFSRAF